MQHQTKMLLQTKQLTMLLQRQKRQQTALPLPLLSQKPVCSSQLRKSCFAILYLLLFVFVNCAGDAVAYEYKAKESTKIRGIGVLAGSGIALDSTTAAPQKNNPLLNNRFSIIADHHAMQKPPPAAKIPEKQHQYQVQLPTRETIHEPLKPIGEKRKFEHSRCFCFVKNKNRN